MYVNKNNRHDDADEIKDFIRQNGFGIVVTQVNGRPWGTHIPLMVGQKKDGTTVLLGHVARANTQWRTIEDQEVMVIFSGPHTYISSSWYDHENVPTWNYLAVHAYGRVRIIEGEELVASISQLVDHYEQHSEWPVSVERMSAGLLTNELRALVGMEITVTEFQSVRKLSQNRDDLNHGRIVEELEKRGDAHSLAIAEEMKTRK